MIVEQQVGETNQRQMRHERQTAVQFGGNCEDEIIADCIKEDFGLSSVFGFSGEPGVLLQDIFDNGFMTRV